MITKEAAIAQWEKECERISHTVRIARSSNIYQQNVVYQVMPKSNNFEPKMHELTCKDHSSIKAMKIMKGDAKFWLFVNYTIKTESYYVPDNKTFELTEQEYLILEKQIQL